MTSRRAVLQTVEVMPRKVTSTVFLEAQCSRLKFGRMFRKSEFHAWEASTGARDLFKNCAVHSGDAIRHFVVITGFPVFFLMSIFSRHSYHVQTPASNPCHFYCIHPCEFWSPSWLLIIHFNTNAFVTQSSSCFLITCPYHLNLPLLIISMILHVQPLS